MENKEFIVIEKKLCNIKPYCDISNLKTALEKDFPTILKAFDIIYETSTRQETKMTQNEYYNLRSFTFNATSPNKSLQHYFCHLKDNKLKKLLQLSTNPNVPSNPNDIDQLEDVSKWEYDILSEIEKWLDEICDEDMTKGISIGVCHHLMCGQPMAALQWYLASKSVKVVKMNFKFKLNMRC